MIKRLYSAAIFLFNATATVFVASGHCSNGFVISILVINLIFITALLYSGSVFRKVIRQFAGDDKRYVGQPLEQQLQQAFSNQQGMLKEYQFAIASIEEIGQDDYLQRLNEVRHPDVRQSLSAAHEKIYALRKKDEDVRWVANGMAIVSNLKNKENNLSQYGDQVVAQLVKYLNANQGSFFVLKGEPIDPHFKLLAAYAYGKKKFLEQRFNPGEGLLGQVYYEKEILYLTDVPKDHVKITSGLGEALPRSICVLPLTNDGKIYGAIEIASFYTFKPHELEFLKKIADTIGFNLFSLDNNLRTHELLMASQKMTEELKSQEEELRQNMEELTATQEEMKRKEKEMDAVLSSVSTVELDLAGYVTHVNPIFSSITGYKADDIVGKLYKSLIPQNGNDPIQYEIMWGNIVDGRSFSGEFRIMNAQQREIWMAGNFTPLLDMTGKPYKVMVISLFTTQDKEKLQELQATVAAFKTIFPIADLSPDLHFKSANDLFLKELGIKRLDLRKTLPSQVMTEISFSRLKEIAGQGDEIIDDLELDILSNEGRHKTYHSALVRMNGAAKKSVLIFKNRK